jgi:E3 ubiquitin-protein ligase EDD1
MSQPLVKCKRVFQALIKLAVEELCETADSLIAPVRLGVARPTAPFTLASTTIDVINVSDSSILHVLLWYFLCVSKPRSFQNTS